MANEATNKAYELWDTETGNVVGAFASEDEALAATRSAVERHGVAYAEVWALVRATPRRVTTIADGPSLVKRACTADHMRRAAS